jgi:hypothetical protein
MTLHSTDLLVPKAFVSTDSSRYFGTVPTSQVLGSPELYKAREDNLSASAPRWRWHWDMRNALRCVAVKGDYSALAPDAEAENDLGTVQNRRDGMVLVSGLLEQKCLRWMGKHHQFITVECVSGNIDGEGNTN